MIDRGKVIKGLELCTSGSEYDDAFCNECPYFVSVEYGCNRKQMEMDAITLLKEQEAEISFLKGMQLKTIHNMSEEDIGNAVAELLQLKGR